MITKQEIIDLIGDLDVNVNTKYQYKLNFFLQWLVEHPDEDCHHLTLGQLNDLLLKIGNLVIDYYNLTKNYFDIRYVDLPDTLDYTDILNKL